MPNIMLTYRCNLKCPYCFANEFVNNTGCDISEADFEYASNFACGNGRTQIGLIGGEPMLHARINDFILSLAMKKEISGVMLYTNGLFLECLEPLSQNPYVPSVLKILVNCNSPDVMGTANYKKLLKNLDLVYTKYHMKDNIKFGVNLYSEALDYSFIKEMLIRYDQHQVRVSLTVPDFTACDSSNPLEQIRSRKAYLLDFFQQMDQIGVLAYLDCNKTPRCIWTDKEWLWLQYYCKKYHSYPSNIADPVVKCSPVIDILPDLRSVRCFGMSDFEKVNIKDFETIRDLDNYFKNKIDAEMFRIPSSHNCTDCYSRRTGKCTGGCLGYMQEKLKKANTLIESL